MTEAEALSELKSFPVNCLDFKEQMALDMAINALEKQIAKKPVIIEKKGLEVNYKCPVCGYRVIEMQPIEKYCRHCGQKLDSEV